MNFFLTCHRLAVITLSLATSIFFSSAFAENSQAEKKESQETLFFTLAQLRSRLEAISSQVTSVQKFGISYSDVSSLNSIGTSKDVLRTEKAFVLAEKHLELGDAERAAQLVTSELKKTSEFEEKQSERAYRILFEAERRLGNHVEAARVCLYAATRSYEDDNGLRSQFDFDAEWVTTCLVSFVKGSFPSSKALEGLTAEEVKKFVYSPVFKKEADDFLVRSMLAAQALKNVQAPKEAIRLLQESIRGARSDNEWTARAYVTLGLLHSYVNETQESLRYLRVVAGDLAQSPEYFVAFETDKYSRFLAKVGLAKLYFKIGQLSAAKTWYLASLTESDVFQISQKQEQEQLSPKRFGEFSEETLRWEYANVLFLLGQFELASAEFSKLLKTRLEGGADNSMERVGDLDSRVLEYARVLGSSPAKANEAAKVLETLFAYADADHAFVKGELKNAGADTLETLVKKTVALEKIARAHGLSVPELARTQMFRQVFENGHAEISRLRRDVEFVLTPVLTKDDGVLEARELDSLKTLLELQKNLQTEILLLDELSATLWQGNSKAREFAELNRKELLRRVHSDGDLVEKALQEKNQNQTERLYEKNSQTLQNTFEGNAKLKAQIGALQFVRQKHLQSDEKVEITEQAQRLEVEIQNSALEHLLYGLQASDVWKELPLFKKKVVVLSNSFRKIYETHSRMRRHSMGAATHVFFNDIDKAWLSAFETQRDIIKAVDVVVTEIKARRQRIAGRAQEILRTADVEERALVRLRSSLKSEFEQLIPKAAAQLEPAVRKYRDETRLAMADTQLQRVRESEDSLKDIQRAREERKQWLRSLKDSIDWGYAR